MATHHINRSDTHNQYPVRGFYHPVRGFYRMAAGSGAGHMSRKSYAEANPELVALARELARPPEGCGRSLRKIAAELAAHGYVTPSGRPYGAAAVRSMLRPRDAAALTNKFFRPGLAAGGDG
jgi:hypothetical protein